MSRLAIFVTYTTLVAHGSRYATHVQQRKNRVLVDQTVPIWPPSIPIVCLDGENDKEKEDSTQNCGGSFCQTTAVLRSIVTAIAPRKVNGDYMKGEHAQPAHVPKTQGTDNTPSKCTVAVDCNALWHVTQETQQRTSAMCRRAFGSFSATTPDALANPSPYRNTAMKKIPTSTLKRPGYVHVS